MSGAAPDTELPIEPVEAGPELVALLRAADLPVADVNDAKPLRFFGCRRGGRLVAAIGIEGGGGDAPLLRSLAVDPAARGRKLGSRLVTFIEHLAAARGESELFLLTNTAADYFRRLGYADIARERAPRSIRASAQFASLCPTDAELLVKSLTEG